MRELRGRRPGLRERANPAAGILVDGRGAATPCNQCMALHRAQIRWHAREDVACGHFGCLPPGAGALQWWELGEDVWEWWENQPACKHGGAASESNWGDASRNSPLESFGKFGGGARGPVRNTYVNGDSAPLPMTSTFLSGLRMPGRRQGLKGSI